MKTHEEVKVNLHTQLKESFCIYVSGHVHISGVLHLRTSRSANMKMVCVAYRVKYSITGRMWFYITGI